MCCGCQRSSADHLLDLDDDEDDDDNNVDDVDDDDYYGDNDDGVVVGWFGARKVLRNI